MAPPKEKDRAIPLDANLGIFNERTGMYETPAPKAKPGKASSSTASPRPVTTDRVPTIFDKGYDKYAKEEALRRRWSPSKGTQAKRESASPLLPRPQSSSARPVVVAAATKPRPAKVVKRVVAPNVPKTWFNDMFGVKGKPN
ncbi:hypothetical protein FQN50_006644 [Emmonsiellopsis sp. PD_5]|nr:hypothetical protein FQN50_006644 [Emmonsiellopsis sp. PD_5]